MTRCPDAPLKDIACARLCAVRGGGAIDGAIDVAEAIEGFRLTVERDTAVRVGAWDKDTTPPTDPTTAECGGATATCCAGGARDCGAACCLGGAKEGGKVTTELTDPSDVIERGWETWAAVRGWTLVATGIVVAMLTVGTVTVATLVPILLTPRLVTCNKKNL